MRNILRRTLTGGPTKFALHNHMRLLAIVVVISLLIASLPAAAGTTHSTNAERSAPAQANDSLPTQFYRSVSETITSIGNWMASFINSGASSNTSTHQPIEPPPLFIDAPTNLTVTAASSSSVNLSWTAPAGTVDHYVVERSENKNGPFIFVANVTGATTKNDTSVTNLHAYLYRVRAVSTTGAVSSPSNMALGTAISFQFSSLLSQEIRAQHFHDVRTAINLVRAVGNVSAASWARGNLVGLEVKADDVNEMRTALDAALTSLSIPVTAYTDPTLTVGASGTLIKAIHIEQLQTRSTRGSSTSSGPVDTGTDSSATARLDPMNQTGGGVDNPLSRNFNFKLPLLSLPGRAGLDLGLTLAYNSLVWTKSGSSISFDDDHGFPGPGFRLGFPVIQPSYYNAEVGKQAYLLINPDGSRTELRQVGLSSLYLAADSSHLLLDDSSMILRSTDGMQMTYVLSGGEFQCTQIKDRNGNFITITYNASGRINTITDTLNRVITFNYTNGWLTSITQIWNQGTPSQRTHTWASFEYVDVTIQTSFTGLTVIGPANNTTIKMLWKVTLADHSTTPSNNSRVEFSNTSWGQVWKVSYFAADNHLLNYRAYKLRGSPLLPTGSEADCPRFTERRDWAENWNRGGSLGVSGLPSGAEQEVVTSYAEPVPDSWTMPDSTTESGMRAQVTRPDGSSDKIYFAGTAGSASGWRRGLPALINTYDGAVLKRQAMLTWTQDNTSLSYQLNPRPTETNTYDPAGNRKRTQITYQQFSFPDGTSSWLQQDSYDYAANATTKLRSTRVSYNTSAAYTNRRIVLVNELSLYDGDVTGTLMSRASYQYDESGSIEGADAPVQHDNSLYSASFVAGRANLSSVKRYNVNNLAQFTTSTRKYNTSGGVVSSADSLGHTSTISYNDSFSDGNNSRNTFAYPTTVNDPDGYSSKSKYNFDFAGVTWRQTPLPNVITNTPGPEQTFTYDAIGRLERTTSLVNNAYTRYEYPSSKNRIDVYTTIEAGLGEAHSFRIMDGVGRVFANASDHPGTTGLFSGRLVLFDSMGRAIKTSNPTETSASGSPKDWQPTGEDQTAGWLYTQQTFDWNGRPLVTTNQDGTTKTVSYTGCGCAGGDVVTLTDEGTLENGNAKKRQQKVYADVLGRTWKAEILNWDGTGPNGTGPNNSVYSATVTTYNARDQVTQVRQFAGPEGSATFQDTTFGYDGYGRLQSKHVPEQSVGAATTWTYNDDDTIQTITDGRGASQTFTHNNRHLTTDITYAAPGGSGIVVPTAVSFAYDAAGNRKTMTDGNGATAYTYDQLSQLTTEGRSFTGLSGTFSITYGYNLGGQLTSLAEPTQFGSTFSYVHDVTGRLRTVNGSPYEGVTTYASNAQYRAWGALKHWNLGNGKALDVTYNQRLREASFNVPGVIEKTYDYYADGTLRFSSDLRSHTWDRFYSYDHLGRIKEAFSGAEARFEGLTNSRPYRQIFSYDAISHMISRTSKIWSANFSTSASYVSNRRVGWSYDNDGNLLSGSDNYTYDARGAVHTVNVADPTDSTVLGLDGDGQQVKTDHSVFNETTWSWVTETTYYLRSTVLQGRVLTEINQTGGKKRTFVYANGSVLAWQVLYGGSIQGVMWEHRDASGASFRTTNSEGNGGVEPDEMPAELDPTGGNSFLPPPPEPPPVGQGESMQPYPNFSDPRNPSVTYTVDGIRVPVDYFMDILNHAFHGNLGLIEAMSRASAPRFRDYTVSSYNGRRHQSFGSDLDRAKVEAMEQGHMTVTANYLVTDVSFSSVPMQQQRRHLEGMRFLSREEIGKLMDNILQTIKEHPDCGIYTNQLLKQLGEDTGYYAGTIEEIVEAFRKRGEIITDDRRITRGGGVVGSSLGFPAVSLTFAETDDMDTAITLLHELLHWAGLIQKKPGGEYTSLYSDEALAKVWNQLGVTMTVEEYRRTYPAHSEAIKKETGTPSDFAGSTLSGAAQFIVCRNEWKNNGYTLKYVDKPKP